MRIAYHMLPPTKHPDKLTRRIGRVVPQERLPKPHMRGATFALSFGNYSNAPTLVSGRLWMMLSTIVVNLAFEHLGDLQF